MKLEFKVDGDIEFPDLSNFIDEFAKETEVRVKRRTPVRSGRLQDSMTCEPVGQDEIEVTSDVEYAPFIEFGTVYIPAFAMVRTTFEEADQIAEVALSKTKVSK